MRKALAPLTFFIAFAAYADSADLRIEIQADSPMLADTLLYGNVFVHNAGPDIARNVVVTMTVAGFPNAQLPCPNGRCFMGNIQPSGIGYVQWRQQMPAADLSMTFGVAVSSDSPDPNLANNNATRNIVVSAAPRLIARIRLPDLIDPGLPFVATLSLTNDSHFAAHEVVMTIELPAGTTATSPPPNCTISPGSIACTFAEIPYSEHPQLLAVTLTAPPRYEGGKLTLTYAAQAREKDLDNAYNHGTAATTLYRTFLVTTTADDGSGSLRAAVRDANGDCGASTGPCAIQFNILEASERPWKTIRLSTPLPPVRAPHLRIDGATQALFSGVANPEGPAIEISGDGSVRGDGFSGDGGCILEIGGLAINGFLGNGITFRVDSPPAGCIPLFVSLHHNFIGTDPTGSIAVPNYRGVGVFQPLSHALAISQITDNVISGNTRSGVFVIRADLDITGNRIGLKAHADEPLPNGASGIYLHESVRRATVRGNIIAFNREMGVAVHPAVRYVRIQENRVWGNGGLAIDDGLDGASPSVNTDAEPLKVPVMTSAFFDPSTQKTTLRGNAAGGIVIEIFAADARALSGAGEAQRFVGAINPNYQTGDFVLTVSGDLRGQWVAATSTRGAEHQTHPDAYTLLRTSELSRAIQVQ